MSTQPMMDLMVLIAKPPHIKRSAVVIMVCLSLDLTAWNLTRLADQATAFQSITYRRMRRIFLRIFGVVRNSTLLARLFVNSILDRVCLTISTNIGPMPSRLLTRSRMQPPPIAIIVPFALATCSCLLIATRLRTRHITNLTSRFGPCQVLSWLPLEQVQYHADNHVHQRTALLCCCCLLMSTL